MPEQGWGLGCMRMPNSGGAQGFLKSSMSAALSDTRVLLLASLREATGNAITAARLAELIPAAEVAMLDINALADADAVNQHVREHGIGLVLGIHAYRAGRLLVGCRVPCAIILGGTDMNVMMDDGAKRPVMLDALRQAGSVVSFNGELLRRLLEIMPGAKAKAFLVAQSIRSKLPPPSEAGGSGPSAEGVAIRRQLSVGEDDVLLLLPAGLRPVKDVLFVAEAVARWHARDPRVVMRVVGPELDADYTQHVRDALCALVGAPRAVAFAGPLPQEQLHLAMREAAVVLNTSQSEGMCNSIVRGRPAAPAQPPARRPARPPARSPARPHDGHAQWKYTHARTRHDHARADASPPPRTVGAARAQLEAFLLGTPVVARSNSGNAALVAHGRTGLLFETADEAVEQAARLLDEPELGAQLARAAEAQVARDHSAQAEAEGYRAALQLALDTPMVGLR